MSSRTPPARSPPILPAASPTGRAKLIPRPRRRRPFPKLSDAVCAQLPSAPVRARGAETGIRRVLPQALQSDARRRTGRCRAARQQRSGCRLLLRHGRISFCPNPFDCLIGSLRKRWTIHRELPNSGALCQKKLSAFLPSGHLPAPCLRLYRRS